MIVWLERWLDINYHGLKGPGLNPEIWDRRGNTLIGDEPQHFGGYVVVVMIPLAISQKQQAIH